MGPERGLDDGTHGARSWFQVVRAVAARPRLWTAALRQYGRMVPRDWWRRRPFLPVPDPGYVRFRVETAYGAHARTSDAAHDIVAYLDWCRDAQRARARGRRDGVAGQRVRPPVHFPQPEVSTRGPGAPAERQL
jgi:hypothetical protein